MVSRLFDMVLVLVSVSAKEMVERAMALRQFATRWKAADEGSASSSGVGLEGFRTVADPNIVCG